MSNGTKDAFVCVVDIRGFSIVSRLLSSEKVSTFLYRFSMLVEKIFREIIPRELVEGNFAEINQFIGDGFLLFFHKDENIIRHESYASIILRFLLKLKDEYNLLKSALENKDFESTALGASIISGSLHYGCFLSIGFKEKSKSPTGVGYNVNKAFRLCDIAQGGQILVEEEILRMLDRKFIYVRLNKQKVKGVGEISPIWIIREKNEKDNKMNCLKCTQCQNLEKCNYGYSVGMQHRGGYEKLTISCNTFSEEHRYTCTQCDYEFKECRRRYDYYQNPLFIGVQDQNSQSGYTYKIIDKECCHLCSSYEPCTYSFFLSKNSQEGEETTRYCCRVCKRYNICFSEMA